MTEPTPPRWDVYRDLNGRPVTLEPEQLDAIWHALSVVDAVRTYEGYPLLSEGAGFKINAVKSRLLGRMLVDGRPPLIPAPPHWIGGAGYHLMEGAEIGHYYFGSTPIPGTHSPERGFVIDPDDPRAPQ